MKGKYINKAMEIGAKQQVVLHLKIFLIIICKGYRRLKLNMRAMFLGQKR